MMKANLPILFFLFEVRLSLIYRRLTSFTNSIHTIWLVEWILLIEYLLVLIIAIRYKLVV